MIKFANIALPFRSSRSSASSLTQNNAEMRKLYSLRQRLLIRMIAGFFFILSIISVGLYAYARDAANETYDLLLAGSTVSILERIVSTPNGINVDIPASALEILGFAKPDRVFYRIFTDQGETLTGQEDLPLPEDFNAESALSRATGWDISTFNISNTDADQPRFYNATYSGETTRFSLQSRLLPSAEGPVLVTVQLGQTRIARDELRNDLMFKGWIGLLSISFLGLFFVWIAINRALKPLSGIVSDIRQRESTDLSPLKTSPPREIVSLIDAINDFMRRLDISKENAQSFIADVAHQMRTSLSALQGQIELVSDATESDEMWQRLRQSERQCERTIRLMNQLLSHAMVIHRGETPTLQPVNLIEIIRGVMENIMRSKSSETVEFQLHRKHITDTQATIMGDPIGLREALINILDNSIKYGPTNNHIDILLHHNLTSDVEEPAKVILTIDDAGPGIAPADRDKVLERFFTAGHDQNSSGLGLNIVAEVARNHNARLTLDQSPRGGLRTVIVFPLSRINNAQQQSMYHIAMEYMQESRNEIF